MTELCCPCCGSWEVDSYVSGLNVCRKCGRSWRAHSGFELSTKKETVDLELHITAKNLAILQGKITCILNELVKKATLLHSKEEEGEEANHLLGIISDNLNELFTLFEQRKELRNQVENLKRMERDQIKK